jgi:hypothetical protein
MRYGNNMPWPSTTCVHSTTVSQLQAAPYTSPRSSIKRAGRHGCSQGKYPDPPWTLVRFRPYAHRTPRRAAANLKSHTRRLQEYLLIVIDVGKTMSAPRGSGGGAAAAATSSASDGRRHRGGHHSTAAADGDGGAEAAGAALVQPDANASRKAVAIHAVQTLLMQKVGTRRRGH